MWAVYWQDGIQIDFLAIRSNAYAVIRLFVHSRLSSCLAISVEDEFQLLTVTAQFPL